MVRKYGTGPPIWGCYQSDSGIICPSLFITPILGYQESENGTSTPKMGGQESLSIDKPPPRPRTLVPLCPDCHTLLGVQWHPNVGQYRHDRPLCMKWLGTGPVSS